MSRIKFYCLVNQSSGGCLGRELINLLKDLSGDCFEVTVEPIIFSEIEKHLNKALNYDRVLVAGGDGTVSFVLSAMQNMELPVGIIPLGTGNDLAKEIGVYKKFSLPNINSLLEFYASCGTKNLRVWKIEFGKDLAYSKLFVNYLSFGFEPAVVKIFDRIRTHRYYFLNKFGPFGNRVSYALAGLCSISNTLNLKKFMLKGVKDQEISAPFTKSRCLLFSNIKSVLGLGISNQNSSAFDDKIECVIYKSILSYLTVISKYVIRISPPVTLASSDEFTVSGLINENKIQIDGEVYSIPESESYKISRSGVVNLLC